MKKFLLLLIVLVGMLFVPSCKNDFSYKEMDKVTYETCLSLPGKYIVVAYQSSCPNCEKLKDTVSKYVKFAAKHDDAMPIYALNVNLAINSDMLISDKADFPSNMIGTSNYKRIKLMAAPAIFVVKNGELIKGIIPAFNTEKPVTEAEEYFKELMK